jgi:vitamin B12 transporter
MSLLNLSQYGSFNLCFLANLLSIDFLLIFLIREFFLILFANSSLTSFSTEIGAASTHKVNLSHAGKVDNISYSFSASDAGTNGISANNIVQYPAENPDRDSYRNKSISGNIANEWSKGQVLGLRFYANDANYHFDGAGFGTPADNSFGQTKQDSVSLFLKNKIQSNWNSNLTLSQNNILSKSQNVNPAPFAAYLINDLTRVTQIQWQNDLILSDDWSAIAGGNLSHQNLNSFADNLFLKAIC